MQNGPFGTQQACASSPIENRSNTFDPLFDPSDFVLRCIPVPDARKEGHDCACFDMITLRGYIRFKYASAVDHINELISRQDPTVLPIKVVINRVTPRRVGTSGWHPFVTHRGGGAFPGISFSGRKSEIDVVALHFSLFRKSHVISYIKFVTLSILLSRRVR